MKRKNTNEKFVIYSQTEPEYMNRLATMKKELNIDNIDKHIDIGLDSSDDQR